MELGDCGVLEICLSKLTPSFPISCSVFCETPIGVEPSLLVHLYSLARVIIANAGICKALVMAVSTNLRWHLDHDSVWLSECQAR